MTLKTMIDKRRLLREAIRASRDRGDHVGQRLAWVRQCAAITEKIDAYMLGINDIAEIK